VTIRLVNTTNRLRIDATLEQMFFATLDPSFANSLELWSREKRTLEDRLHESHIDVELVSKEDLDRVRDTPASDERSRYPDMDLLGVYVSHDASHLHSRILVSPEKVMSACHTMQTTSKPSLDIELFYPTLLSAVIVHELAHLLMDPHHKAHQFCARSWKEQGLTEASRQKKNAGGDHACDVTSTSRMTARRLNHNAAVLVEESLANALVLPQSEELKQFMQGQPPEYRAGLRWTGSLSKLLSTAASWRQFKADVSRYNIATWRPNEPSPLKTSAGVLASIEKIINDPSTPLTSFNFQ
jgi:hypothetical protein